MRPVKTEDTYPSICVVEAHNLYHLLQNHFKDHNTRDLRVLRTRRLRRLDCFAAGCFAALSASLTCAYWKYFGGFMHTHFFFFRLEGVCLFIIRRLKICLGYVDNLIVFRLNKSMNSHIIEHVHLKCKHTFCGVFQIQINIHVSPWCLCWWRAWCWQ